MNPLKQRAKKKARINFSFIKQTWTDIKSGTYGFYTCEYNSDECLGVRGFHCRLLVLFPVEEDAN
jgi:hypothetical protein